MATPPSRPSNAREQMIARRWDKVRSVRLLSNADKRGKREVKTWRSKLPAPINWKRWLLGTGGVLSAVLLANVAVAWLRAPSVNDIKSGAQLFAHKWEANDPLSAAGDGLGPVFNARSCAECHFQGGIGGAGGLAHNVAAFEVMPTAGHPEPTGGVIHSASLNPRMRESRATMRQIFPIIPRGLTITAVCQQPLVRDYDPVIQHSINTPTLFGAGDIDRISEVAIRAQHTQRMLSNVGREFELKFDLPSPGRVRILPDGRIGKFGWKAQFATLEEFVANACAVEVGLTTPTRKQHRPLQHKEDPEAQPDLNDKQFRQLVAYVAKLPAPQLIVPASSRDQALVTRGEEVFTTVGCAACHTPDLGSAKGVYSDFCLHDVADPDVQGSSGYRLEPQVPVPDDYPRPSEWKTPPLWGVAQTAPYMHDGSAPTLIDAIQAHSGQAKTVRENFRHLHDSDRIALVRFLNSLAVR